MSILIKNGRIITAENDYISDIYIERDKVNAIGVQLTFPADQIIDANGKLVIPGGVDVHTHLNMPLGKIFSSDDFETGTRAAAFGGTTTIVDFATQTSGMRMTEALDVWHKKADGKACIDYGFHMIITDLPDIHLDDMTRMVEEGVTSFKLFMAYPGSLMVDDKIITKAMIKANDVGGLVCIHAENGNEINTYIKTAISENKTSPVYHALTRPTSTEAMAVQRSIALSKSVNAPVYIVHVSSHDALVKIIEAKDRGEKVFAETCPQYLFLSVDDLMRPDFEGAKYVLTPPLREKWNQEKLWEGLRKKYLQVVSTDHCPFNFYGEKEMGKNDFTKIPNGGPGIENRMQLIYDGGVRQNRISLNQWIDLTSTTPAKIFGMFPRKGTISIGSDADLVIWNQDTIQTISSQTHHMNVDYSMYEGFPVGGTAEVVISRGEVIIGNGVWLGKAGMGKFIKRQSYQLK